MPTDDSLRSILHSSLGITPGARTAGLDWNRMQVQSTTLSRSIGGDATIELTLYVPAIAVTAPSSPKPQKSTPTISERASSVRSVVGYSDLDGVS